MSVSENIVGNPFWTSTSEIPNLYPWMSQDEDCDVAIIGGGVTAAMAAYRFSQDGIKTVLISRSPIGYGATGISLGILDYSVERGLIDLGKMLGKEKAVRCFKLCEQAIDNIEDIVESFDKDVGFLRRDVLAYTSDKQKQDEFNTEYLMRKHNNFDVSYLEKNEARDMFSFNIEAGILSKNLGAEVNPYLLTHALVEKAVEQGAKVYENTEAINVVPGHDSVEIQTGARKKLTTKKLILATGFSQNSVINSLLSKKTTFMLTTNAVEHFSGYESRCIIKNDRAPYTYIRTTPDDRLIIGGLSSNAILKDGRLGKLVNANKIVKNKHKELENKLNLMFCAMPDMEAEYEYSGAVADTYDHLPIIGEQQEYPNVLFDICCGANGIVFSEIASRILLSLYHGEQNEDMELFSPSRESL
ncbi:MAG: hypothetical protein K0R90_458 [Oscillospiraceae bacterium]|jgi:glycine/D-amino acid oxidase-like deaminating enzyme|nr:hypothetical protein [Oscillospiraceae bacterium]